MDRVKPEHPPERVETPTPREPGHLDLAPPPGDADDPTEAAFARHLRERLPLPAASAPVLARLEPRAAWNPARTPTGRRIGARPASDESPPPEPTPAGNRPDAPHPTGRTRPRTAWPGGPRLAAVLAAIGLLLLAVAWWRPQPPGSDDQPAPAPARATPAGHPPATAPAVPDATPPAATPRPPVVALLPAAGDGAPPPSRRWRETSGSRLADGPVREPGGGEPAGAISLYSVARLAREPDFPFGCFNGEIPDLEPIEKL